MRVRGCLEGRPRHGCNRNSAKIPGLKVPAKLLTIAEGRLNERVREASTVFSQVNSARVHQHSRVAARGASAATGEADLNRPDFSASCGDYSAVPKICRDYSGRAGHFTNVDGCARFRADQMDSSLRLSSRQFPQPESRGLRQGFGGSNRRQAFDQSLSQCVAASGIRDQEDMARAWSKSLRSRDEALRDALVSGPAHGDSAVEFL